MIYLKSQEEVLYISKAGKIIAEVFKELKSYIRVGIKTKDLDKLAYELITKKYQASPAFLGYNNYPASICVSINEEVIHALPSERIIKDGDIIKLDLGVCYKGYYCDASITVGVGNIREEARRLIKVAKQALYIGIEKAKCGNRVGDISYAINNFVKSNGYEVVRDFAGHGVGISLHEEPEVPNWGRVGIGPKLREGMVICIEPMINAGSWEVEVLEDNWTIVTKDRSLSVHFEHAVYIQENTGPVVLTPWDNFEKSYKF